MQMNSKFLVVMVLSKFVEFSATAKLARASLGLRFGFGWFDFALKHTFEILSNA